MKLSAIKVQRIISTLNETSYIERVGTNNGKWLILK